MLLGMDEYPYHQITNTFAAVAGSDPQWNDGHYVCRGDDGGQVCFTSNVRLYQNNDVLDGFVCLRHEGRQHNIRVSRRLRPDMGHLGVGPLRLEMVEPLRAVRLVLEPGDHGFALDVVCRSTAVPYMDPIEITRVDGRLISERATYEVTGECEGWVSVGDHRVDLRPETSAFFRNHSWGYQAGRGGPRPYGAPLGTPRRVPGIRQWVLFHMPDHGGFFFEDPKRRAASGHGMILLPDRAVPIRRVDHDLRFYEGERRLQGGSLRARGRGRDGPLVRGRGPRVGVLPGRRLLRWLRRRTRPGRVPRRLPPGRRGVGRQPPDADRRAPTEAPSSSTTTWAENFTRLRSGDATGLAHYECVVIRPPQEAA